MISDLANFIKSKIYSILRHILNYCKKTEQILLFKYKWYRKLRRGHFILIDIYGQKIWYRNSNGIDQSRILKEENYNND